MTREEAAKSAAGQAEFRASSGNVFDDLGASDAQERHAKALLSRRIDKAIEDRGLTQQQAAEILGCAQPDVSNLVRGKVGGYTIDRLSRFLVNLGYSVEIRVVEPECANGARLAVTA